MPRTKDKARIELTTVPAREGGQCEVLTLTTLEKGDPPGTYRQDSAVTTEEGENRFEIKVGPGIDLDLQDAHLEFESRDQIDGACPAVDQRKNKITITYDRTLAPEQTGFWLEVERDGQMEPVYSASLRWCEDREEHQHESDQKSAETHHYRPPPTVGGGGNVD